MALVLNHHHKFGDRQLYHADEMPPGLLTGELLDYWLDRRWVIEYPERRSLYKLFAPFSGCTESEQLTEQESAAYALPK